MKKFIVPVVLALAATISSAGPSGAMLLDSLKSPDRYSQGVAMGYIQGVLDLRQGLEFCLTPQASLGQVRDAVEHWLDVNPFLTKYSAYATISFAVANSWPCGAKL